MPTQSQLEKQYDVPVFTQWHKVPENLKTRAWFRERGVKIYGKDRAKAVKTNLFFNAHKRYFLFDVDDFKDKLTVRLEYSVWVYFGERGHNSEMLLRTWDKAKAERFLKEYRGKLHQGNMAIYEMKSEEIFEAKK